MKFNQLILANRSNLLAAHKNHNFLSFLLTAITAIIVGGFFAFNTIKSTAHANVMDYKTYKLDNGIILILAQTSSVPLINLFMTFKAGSGSETPETSGFTHFLEHMFFKRNKNFKSKIDFKEFVKKYGLSYNGSTYHTYTDFILVGPSMNFDKMLYLTSSVAKYTEFTQKDIDLEKTVVIDEFNRRQSNLVFYKFYVSSARMLFGDLFHTTLPIGISKSYIKKNVDVKIMQKLRDEIMAPSNTTILIVGDIKYESAKKMVESYFGDWKDPEGYKPPKFAELKIDLKATKTYNYSHPRKTNASIKMIYAADSVEDEPRLGYAGQILTDMLRLKNGKFYKKFIETGKHYDSGLYLYYNNFYSRVKLYCSVDPKEVDQTIKDLKKEYELMLSDDYFNEDQLSDVKNKISMIYKIDSDDLFKFTGKLNSWTKLFGAQYYKDYLKNTQKTSLKDIKEFIEKYIVGKHSLISVFYNSKAAEELKIDLNGDKYFKKHFSHLVSKTK